MLDDYAFRDECLRIAGIKKTKPLPCDPIAPKSREVNGAKKGKRFVTNPGEALRPKSFLGKSHKLQCVYVVSLIEHPEVVKIGQTANWTNRRKSYAQWNLSKEDAISQEMTFSFSDEYVNLLAIENQILCEAPFELHYGREWFKADFDQCARHVSRVIDKLGLSAF